MRNIYALALFFAGALTAAIACGGERLAAAGHLDAKVESASPEDLKPADRQPVQQLIRQLGDPQYAVRREAAGELKQIGAEAFDLLHAATADSDPEVAASAHYLLRQIAVRWVQSDDSAVVRGLLRDYDRQSTELRLKCIEELSKLAEGEGVGALCRIARFDRSPLASRSAALAIIRPAQSSGSRASINSELLERSLGGSTRDASVWLRQYLTQLRDPASSVPAWQRIIDEESARLARNANDTSTDIVGKLMWNLADIYRQLGDTHSLAGVLDRMMAIDADSLDQTAVELLDWLTKDGEWSVLDEFLDKHQAQIEQSKRPLYYAAIARAKQGKSDLAEELAAKAVQLEPQSALPLAKDLEEHSQFDWSVREYRQAIEKSPQDSLEMIMARLNLSSLLQDYEHYREAADTLEPLVTALRGQGRIAKVYTDIQQYYERRGGGSGLPDVKTLGCRLHYYRACQYREEGDSQRYKDELKTAIEFDPTDADVLIDMFRVTDADADWHEATRAKIRALAAQLHQKIDAEPQEPTNFNQWAWLVSNTEGDFQKAIRYSHRSLELNARGDSAAASYLDTLARCYYAAGDYEKAIDYEQKAIAKIDYMQVMHRQLALFEKALAEKHGKGATE